eukprot:TRINITY_DN22561_c0_g1_i1.p1 TRINITY_DN22561_c0_g1~~TRINITY_DN22561_c0_g1_i1.p1  ORF type:complete len:704 (+),score=175.78 TRINITY_DN22561_c0_g1_i1:40-2151(+)
MGRGSGCCSDRPVLSTYAGDTRTAEEVGLTGETLENPSRGCISTDCPMLLVFIVFWIGMFVIAGYSFENGDPLKLVYGTDYRMHRCGSAKYEPDNWAEMFANATKGTNRFKFQSPEWTENKYVWYPVPLDGDLTPTAMNEWSASRALRVGICVSTCPKFGFANTTAAQVIADRSLYNLLTAVFSYGVENPNGTVPEPFYNVWYDSDPVLRRCIPNQKTLEAIAGELRNVDIEISHVAHVSGFFEQGLGELEEGWRVLLVGILIALGIGYVLVALVYRLFLKPLIWIMCIAIIVCLGVGGYFAYRKYDNLWNNDFGDDDNEAKAYLAVAVILWVFCFLAFCLFVWFVKRINAACDIINAAGMVMVRDFTLLLVPVITGLFAIGLFVFLFAVALYTYTIHEDEDITLTQNIDWAHTGVNESVTVPDEYSNKRNMLYYILFGWLWTFGVIHALGFFAVAVATTTYYYSHADDSQKGLLCCFPWLKGLGWGLLYHLGAFVTGALLVAIIQFIRWVIYHTAMKLQDMSTTLACLVCCVQCLLGCVERFLQYVSQNAYIVMAIEGGGFWPSCCTAVDVMLNAISYLGTLSLISHIVFFLTKLVVTLGTVFLGYWLLEDGALAPNVENGFLILVVLAIVAYFCASLFVSVYEAVIDSMCILVFHELNSPKDPANYFCPGFIFETITGHDKKEARKVKESLKPPTAPDADK